MNYGDLNKFLGVSNLNITEFKLLVKILNAIHAQNIGGVNQVFKDYTQALRSRNHDVALLISDNNRCSYDVDTIFKLKNLSPILDIFHMLWIFFKFRPDVVICHSPRLMYNIRLLRFTGVKIIGVNHGTSFKKSLFCDYVISVNNTINVNVIGAGFDSNKAMVISNAIDVNKTYQEQSSQNTSNMITIGTYGRLESAKGFDILIEAAAILQKRLKGSHQDFCLKIGGFEVPGHIRWDDMKALAKERGVLDKCKFVGLVVDKDDFFRDVDICCVSSREETFGLVILEGFLQSKLVISSDTDGGKFLIEDGVDGILFKKEDPNDLANKIEKLLDGHSYSAKDCNLLTKTAFKKLENKFSLNSLAKKLEELFQKIPK